MMASYFCVDPSSDSGLAQHDRPTKCTPVPVEGQTRVSFRFLPCNPFRKELPFLFENLVNFVQIMANWAINSLKSPFFLDHVTFRNLWILLTMNEQLEAFKLFKNKIYVKQRSNIFYKIWIVFQINLYLLFSFLNKRCFLKGGKSL